MSKKTTNCFSPRAGRIALLGFALGVGAAFGMAPSAQAKPEAVARLEIWPGQRVTVVLPLALSADWNSDTQLGAAIIPIIQPELQNALIRSQKFSLTLPYRFDPILQRAVQERRVAENDLDTYLGAPSIESVQPVLSKFSFNQPSMVVDAKLEALNISGTPQRPLVQVKVSGSLYQNGTGLFRPNTTVTSLSFGGKTPEDRLRAAAADAFNKLVAQFILPPPSFELPVPVTAAPPAATPTKTPTSAPTKPTSPLMTGAEPSSGTTMPPATTVPKAPVATPNTIPTVPNGGFLPQLPGGQPPLGITVPDQPAGTR